MARKVDVADVREELVQALRFGDEKLASSLVSQLGEGPRQVRAFLETMLADPDSRVRQAAVFGLGELGGAATAKHLELLLATEEALEDYDGEAVVEEIVRVLGRSKAASARTRLLRRLERLPARKPERSDVYEMAYALWKQRHPDMIAPIRQSLDRLALPAPHGLHGLLVLLERSPEELRAWALSPAVDMGHKTEVLAVLHEDVPDTLVPVLPAFISTAEALGEQALRQDDAASDYCQCLLTLLRRDKPRLLTALPEHARSELRSVALRLIAATFPNPSIAAAVVVGAIGRPEDAQFLEAHCPTYPVLAKVFQDAARALRDLH